ncbi:hypothetical protein LENED_006678 [Lentinula edodes]|uniref:Uncharacterized protein n=1 Tax=Lentinula edodes TaxID=5353 RepID=A0A1Q3ECE4_LENED|nr:hypothetical protein LENED_006678 [Lentinula edodes]
MVSSKAASHLFALLCLWTVVLAVFASPLPAPSGELNKPVPAGDPSKPVPSGDLRKPAPASTQGEIRDVRVAFRSVTIKRHNKAYIGIGNTILTANKYAAGSLEVTTDSFIPTMVPTKENLSFNVAAVMYELHVYPTLGQAKFKDGAEEKEFIDKVLATKLPLKNFDDMDFVTRVMERLNTSSYIDQEVLGKWKKIQLEMSL